MHAKEPMWQSHQPIGLQPYPAHFHVKNEAQERVCYLLFRLLGGHYCWWWETVSQRRTQHSARSRWQEGMTHAVK